MLRLTSINAAGQLVSTTATSGAGFIISVIVTRGLGANVYGEYAYAYVIYATLLALLTLGVTATVSRFGSFAIGEGKPAVLKGLVKFGIRTRLVVFGIATVGIVIFLDQVLWITNMQSHQTTLLVTWGLLLPNSIMSVFQAGFAAMLRSDISAKVILISTFFRIVLFIVGVRAQVDVPALLLIDLAAMTLSVALYPRLFRQYLSPSVPSDQSETISDRTDLRRFMFSMTMISIVDLFIWSRTELFFIQRMEGLQNVAFYSIGIAIPLAIQGLIPSALNQSVMPVIGRMAGAGRSTELVTAYSAIIRAVMFVGLPISLGGIICSPYLVELLYGVDAMPAVAVMQITFVSSFLTTAIGTHSSILYGLGEPGFNLRLGAVIAPAGLLLSFFMVREWGIIGGATSKVAVYSMFFIPMIAYTSSKTGGRWPKRSTLLIVASSLLMALVVMATTQVPVRLIIRLPLAVVMGVIAYAGFAILLGAISRTEMRRIYEAVRT